MLIQQVLDDACAARNKAQQIFQNGCLVAGTLIHTKDELKPIEQIKVGDWVLSKPESGEGDMDYKRVTKTYKLENKEVLSIEMYDRDAGQAAMSQPATTTDKIINFRVVVTPNHPFWVKGKGWMGYG